ncbi:MAG: hypothetical protein HOW73_20595 [Polyangiaceae bacterium]|nr:hypothetical protein [Polyangiaceae bacterium]
MPSAIRIRVGASVDPSVRTVFKSFEAAAEQAAKKAKTSTEAATKSAARESRAKVAAAVAADRQYATAWKRFHDSQSALEAARNKRAIKSFEEQLKASKKVKNERERAAKAEEREILSSVKTIERAERAAARSKQRTEERAKNRRERFRDSAFRDFGGRAASNVAAVGRGAVGIGRDIAGGLGVDTSLRGGIERATSLESIATDIVNSASAAGNMEATTDNVKRLTADIRKAANEAKVGFEDMGLGVQDFVTKSADVDLARKNMLEIAKVAQATGTNVNDALSMGGDIAKSLPDNEKDALLPLIRLFAKQGSMGNVEVKDLAKYAGRMISTSFQFTGTREENMGRLGAMAQVAMRGGRSSAAEGARAAGSFARDITKDAANKRFRQAGIDIYTDKSKTKIRNQEDIIVDVFKKTKGSQAKLAKLFQNEMSKSIMLGFGDIYDQAGGGDAGIKAIRDEFKKFTTSMSADDVNTAFELKAGTDKAKAQEFQNRLDEMSARLVERVVPALEKFEPSIIKAADSLGNMTAWAVENPGTAITGAIVASIAKAGIGAAFTALVASSATATAALAGIAVVGIAAAAALKMGFDAHDEQVTEAAGKTGDRQTLLDQYESAKRKLERGELGRLTGAEARSIVDAPRMIEQVKQEREQATKLDNPLTYLNALVGEGEGWDSLMQKRAYKTRDEENDEILRRAGGKTMQDPLANLDARIAAAVKGGLASAKIEVTVNGATGVDQGGRVGPLSMFPSFFTGG